MTKEVTVKAQLWVADDNLFLATENRVQIVPPQQRPSWTVGSRIAFRFCLVYFGLFCLLTQIFGGLLPIPLDFPDPSNFWPTRQIVTWTEVHVFGVTHPLVYMGGSGDKVFDWVLVFCLLVVAAVSTIVWSFLDRRRLNYVTLNKWFRVAIRFALASQMLGYGMTKVVPLQMPFPYLTKLLEPFGHFSPMNVLWFSVGASPGYEMFAGSAEVLAGILLIIPATATLGALVCLADCIQIFTLNMTYDVPVKLFSFHLLLMSLFLLAPELRRLADFFVLNRAPGRSTQPPLFRTRRANRFAVVAQVVFGMCLLGMNIYSIWSTWSTYGIGAPKSALYGIWNVDQLSIDGQVHPPLLTDADRWRRVVFEFPDAMTFQKMDDSFAYYGAAINTGDKSIALTKFKDESWKANFKFQRPAANQLTLDGEMDHHKIHMQLQLVDRNSFTLVNRRFHWVQEFPFQR
jgi:uncharacterized membrane protein YphA (DoxX/SURF4 family)